MEQKGGRRDWTPLPDRLELGHQSSALRWDLQHQPSPLPPLLPFSPFLSLPPCFLPHSLPSPHLISLSLYLYKTNWLCLHIAFCSWRTLMNTIPKPSEHLSNCQVRLYMVSDPPKPRGTQQLQAILLTSLLNGCTARGMEKNQVQNEWCAVPSPSNGPSNWHHQGKQGAGLPEA